MNNISVYSEQQTGNMKYQGGGSVVFSKQVTATLAEINAGKQVIDDVPGRTIRIVGGRLKSNGAFTTLTAIELQESDGSPVIASFAQANLTDGAVFDLRNTITGQTIGAGFNADLTAGKGVKIVKTGSTGAGGTNVEVILDFVVVS